MGAADVFINCPFSGDYEAMFSAIVFAVVRCGFNARCAREVDDGGQVRIEKICTIIGECRYSIHDISKTELDAKSRLPRFNMPLELGIFLGAKRFGGRAHSGKRVLILDRAPYRYRKFISDIAGQDIHAHGGTRKALICKIVNWLRQENPRANVPGGLAVARQYQAFRRALPKIAEIKRLAVSEITFRELAQISAEWILEMENVRAA